MRTTTDTFLKQPFALFLYPFCVGVLLQKYFILNILIPLLLIAALILIVVSCINFNAVSVYRKRYIFQISLSFLMFSSGALIAQIKNNKNINFNEGNYRFAVELNEFVRESEKTLCYNGKFIFIKDSLNNEIRNIPDKIIIYLKKDSSHLNITEQNIILGKGIINRIKNRGNPSEFNYAEYTEKKGYYYSVYIDQAYRYEGYQKKSGIKDFSKTLKNKLSRSLDVYEFNDRVSSFLRIITLGDKEYLDETEREKFAISGIAHILAVSGLHTGIIYSIISFLLLPLLLINARKIRYFLIIIFLWGYVFIVGGYPSVIRAATMLTLFLIGKILMKQSNSINLLYATALIMLIYNPNYLYDIGFQLSFLSVLSILIFFPLFRNYYNKSGYWGHKFFDLINISISAQILILPLTLHYFHIFPAGFLFSNLLIIPVLPFLLFISMLSIGLSLSGLYFMPIKILINYICKYIFGVTDYISNIFSFSESSLIYIDEVSVIIITALSCSIVYVMKRKNGKSIIILLVLILLIVIHYDYDLFKRNNDENMFVLNNNKNNSIHYIKKDKQYIICMDSVIDKTNIDRITKNNNGIKRIKENIYLNKDTIIDDEIIIIYPFIKLNDKSFCILNSDLFHRKNTKEKIEIDYLVICRGFKGYLSDIKQYIDFKEIILTSSLSYYRIEQIKKECLLIKKTPYNINDEGAFIFKSQHLSEH